MIPVTRTKKLRGRGKNGESVAGRKCAALQSWPLRAWIGSRLTPYEKCRLTTAGGATKSMKKEEILAKLAAGELKVEEASKLLAEVEQPKRGSLYCKVSAKGALSVYGLQRMPVTLYLEQWERLLDFSDELRAFLKENDAQFKRKER
jgi:hypothetical protein